MMSAYGIRFCESSRDHGELTDIQMTIVAHPFHRPRVDGPISALTSLLEKRVPDGTMEVVWSEAEPDERDVLAILRYLHQKLNQSPYLTEQPHAFVEAVVTAFPAFTSSRAACKWLV